MTTVTYRLEDLKKAIIELGFVGENEHRMIRFDSAKLFEEYPDAVVALTVVAPSGEAYPAVAGRDGDFVSWVVTDSDLVKDGSGELQLTFIEGNAVAKTYKARTKVYESIEPTGEAPTPVENWMIAANAALNGIPVTIQNALTEAKESGVFDGKDGVGIVSISKTSTSGKVDTYTVTLSDGSTYPITVTNGEDGEPGEPGYTPQKGVDYFDGEDGQDGVSPTVSVTDIQGGHRVIITDKDHPLGQTFDVMDGSSATAPVTDVQANGTSILDDGVANIPLASTTNPGLIILGTGLYKDASSEKTVVDYGSSSQIKAGTSNIGVPISRQHVSAFYALAKLAGVDLASQTVTVGQYPDSAKIAIQKMLGIYEAPWELISEETFTNASEADHIITVDQYGESFELTDVIVAFTTPQQNNVSGKGDYGRIRFWYGTGGYSYKDAYFNQYTQQANAEQRTGYAKITQTGGLLEIVSRSQNVRSNTANSVIMGGHVTETGSTSAPVQLPSAPLVFNKINITAVTGTAKVWVYGKRKWN